MGGEERWMSEAARGRSPSEIEDKAYDALTRQHRLHEDLLMFSGAFAGLGLALVGLIAVQTIRPGITGDSVLLHVGGCALVSFSIAGAAYVRWRWLARREPDRRTFCRELLPEYLERFAYCPGWDWGAFLASASGGRETQINPGAEAPNNEAEQIKEARQRIQGDAFKRLCEIESKGYPYLCSVFVPWQLPLSLVVVDLLLLGERFSSKSGSDVGVSFQFVFFSFMPFLMLIVVFWDFVVQTSRNLAAAPRAWIIRLGRRRVAKGPNA
jgi:hypothetical protein